MDPPRTKSLASFWPFDGVTADVRADLNGNPIGATSFAPAAVGQGTHFDNGARIETNDKSYYRNSPPLTFATWVKFDSVSGDSTLMERTAGADGWRLSKNVANHFVFEASTNRLTGSSTVLPGTWYHVAGILDFHQAHLSVNGVIEASTLIDHTRIVVDPPVPLTFGASRAASPRNLRGTLDEAAIWNQAVPLDELRTYFERHQQRLASPLRSQSVRNEPGPLPP